MVSPQALAIALAVALTYFAGVEAVRGVQALGREAKKAGAAVVRVLKKIPMPNRHDDEQPESEGR